MRLSFLLPLFCLLSCLATAPVGVIRSVNEQYDNAVRIGVICGTDVWGGSGVLIDGDTIYTAYHVVECEQAEFKIAVKFSDGSIDYATLVEGSALVDLAEIRLAKFRTGVTPPVIGPKPRLGDTVCLVVKVPDSARKCGEVQPYGDYPGNLEHTAITEHGNSGGGVYDSAGRLVAIVTHLRLCETGQICGGRASTLR